MWRFLILRFCFLNCGAQNRTHLLTVSTEHFAARQPNKSFFGLLNVSAECEGSMPASVAFWKVNFGRMQQCIKTRRHLFLD